MRLQSVRVSNFKAIKESKTLRLGALTAFIGNNGSGKSSVVEALETYQTIVRDGLDIAMQRWLGIEHVRNKKAAAKLVGDKTVNPITFELRIGEGLRKSTDLKLQVNNDPASNQIFIEYEKSSHANGWYVESDLSRDAHWDIAGQSILRRAGGAHKTIADHILSWQFLNLNPDVMGLPVPQQRTEGQVKLAKNGANIADYLLDIRRLDVAAYEGIVDTMAYVLPYSKDIQPSVTSELERKAYLQLSEADFKIPGWMLSTGTLRVLALLALLRHPNPPPLIVVEEIENGLDPRTIHLIVEEIRNAVLDGVTQVIITTHSPYLLDLLKLEHLVLVERDQDGHPTFFRPDSDKKLQQWADNFAPGKLYTMGSFSRSGR